jgi:hypothetical protein
MRLQYYQLIMKTLEQVPIQKFESGLKRNNKNHYA